MVAVLLDAVAVLLLVAVAVAVLVLAVAVLAMPGWVVWGNEAWAMVT